MNAIARCWAYCRATIETRSDRAERGASLVEYGLLLALIVVVCVAAVTFIGESTGESLSETASLLD